MQLRRKLFSAISWRTEARATSLPADHGQQLRDRCGRIMQWAGAHHCLPDLSCRAAILCFHNVIAHQQDPEVEKDALEVGKFRSLLRILRRSFNVISLAELVAAVREQRSPPPRSIVITFDDGYITNYTVVAQEMAALHMPWSTFVPAALIETGGRQWIDDLYLLIHRGRQKRLGFHWENQTCVFDLNTPKQRHAAAFWIREACRYLAEPLRRQRLQAVYDQYSRDELEHLRSTYPDFAPLTWQQARELLVAGVDVGSHGLSHIALAPQEPEIIEREVLAAARLLQSRLGYHSPHFSYPYGRETSISDDTETVLRRVGYHCALTLVQDAVHTRQVNLMRLPRLIVSPLIGRVLFGLWQRFIR